ncbi:hypothetical protein Aperf_G00000088010 [Anoplocephala perfoliata]
MPIYKVNTEDPPEEFKAKLFSLTGVPIERQKIFIAGAVLGDISFEGMKLRDGAHVMLMGTAEKLPTSIITNASDERNQKVVHQKEEPELVLPIGLINLGNTCYMNSATQLLYSIPEFRAFVQRVPISSLNLLEPNVRGVFTALRLIFAGLGSSKGPILPINLLESFCKAFPQFGTQTSLLGSLVEPSQQIYEQQDANECFLEFIRILQQLKADSEFSQAHPDSAPLSFGQDSGWNPVDRFFTGEFACTLTNKDNETEPPVHTTEKFLQLSCYISQDIKFLHTGLKNSLECKLQKKSPTSGEEMTYVKVSLYSRLPAYLCIQIMRFFYKEKTKSNTKIMKDIKFQMAIDLYEDCTIELKAKMEPYRAKMDEMIDKEKNAVKKRGKAAAAASNPPNPEDNPDMYEPYWLPDDLGSNNTGRYELQAVLTHKGRGNSGHYVTWVKRKGNWFVIDDSNSSLVQEEDILRLSGGGEYHSAYILLYGPARIRTSVPEAEEETEEKVVGTTDPVS